MNEYWQIHIQIMNIRSVTENIQYSNIIHIHWTPYLEARNLLELVPSAHRILAKYKPNREHLLTIKDYL